MAVEDAVVLHDGRIRFLRVTVRRHDGVALTHHIEDHGRAAAVLPYDPARRMALLVAQVRVPPYFAARVEGLLEVPAGMLENDAPEDGARREAMEEAGVALGALELVATAWPMPGVSTERIDLFLAPYTAADRIGSGGGLAAEQEAIAVGEHRLADLLAMACAGELADMKTMLLVLALHLRRPDLFA